MNTEENFEFSKELASFKSRALAVFLDIFILMVFFLPFHAFRSVAAETIYIIFYLISPNPLTLHKTPKQKKAPPPIKAAGLFIKLR